MTDAAAPSLAPAAAPLASDRAAPWIRSRRRLEMGACSSWSPAIVIVPLLATALGGFKSLGELRTNPFGLPDVWVWQNYWDILSS